MLAACERAVPARLRVRGGTADGRLRGEEHVRAAAAAEGDGRQAGAAAGHRLSRVHRQHPGDQHRAAAWRGSRATSTGCTSRTAPTSARATCCSPSSRSSTRRNCSRRRPRCRPSRRRSMHAETEFKRYSRLFEQKAAAATDVDNWRYQRDSAKAALMNAQAQVDLAKLNLSYTQVTAPFNGRMGRRLVDPGNLVGAGGQETTLAEINQIDPIYVYFTINELELLRVRKLQQEAGGGDYRVASGSGLCRSRQREGLSARGAHRLRRDQPSIRAPGRCCCAPSSPIPTAVILPGLFVRHPRAGRPRGERHPGSGGGARLRSDRPLRAGRQRQERRRAAERQARPDVRRRCG